MNGLVNGHVDWTDVGIATGSGFVGGFAFAQCLICAGAAAGATSSFLTDTFVQAHHNGWNFCKIDWE